MKNLLFVLFALIILTSYACGDDETTVKINRINDYDASLFADYSNPTTGSPTLSVDLPASSSEINIELDPITTEENGRILFNFSGVTFKEDRKVYIIDELITERLTSDNCWIIDNENTLTYTFSKSLDVILVLDVSSSLGNNIETIKSNSQQMVSRILNQNPDAMISVVKFSRGSVTLDFTSSESEINQFIQQNTVFDSPDIGSYELEGRNETALYESVNEAIVTLNESDARGKGILTFTDGVSNFQFEPQFQTADNIISSLNDSNISSYTIGFDGNEGSVDRTALESISINGDFSFPNDLEDLDEVFVRFSNSVAAVYDLVYDTNNAVLDAPIEYRFLFNTTQISE